MVAGWMLYFVLFSALLLGAARLLEEAARRLRFPLRGIWAGTLAASVLLPVLIRATPRTAPLSSGEALIGVGIPVAAPAAGVAGDPSAWSAVLAALPRLDPVLLAGWGACTVLLLLFGLASVVRLRTAARQWRPLAGSTKRILVSEATGPAVVGLLGGAIVLPRWAATGDPAMRELMLSHEEEHLRARDPLLLLAATVLTVLLPWNLPLWWQLRRLRLAVEVDCDARVLGRGSDLRSYATLLMEVGRRRAGLDPALLAFAEPASFLEQRIRLMTHRRGRGWLIAAGSLALSSLLVVGACSLDQPAEPADVESTGAMREGPSTVVIAPGGADGSQQERAEEGAAEGRDPLPGDEPDGPRFTPMSVEPETELTGAGQSGPRPAFTPRDVEPELQNRTEFGRALEAAYPTALKAAGIGGRAVLWVRVDETGGVSDVQVFTSSGHEELDAAAMRVMRTARFSPAELNGAPVAVWVALPITMQPDGGAPARDTRTEARPLPPVAPSGSGDSPQQAESLAERPAFTPRQVEPELRNRTEFGRALERAYPAALKNAGIGGSVGLWVFITETGAVGNVRIADSSGNDALDAAAAEAMKAAVFSPAANRGSPVPVWVMLPVTFQTATQ